MELIHKTGNPKLASVYIAKLKDGECIEFVESRQPPHSIMEKWILIVSTLRGCPVDCSICDAGGRYKGILSAEEIISQIDYMVADRFPDRHVPSKKFKIQFARMGDPAFNINVIEVLKKLPTLYPGANIIPSVSSIAPRSCEKFFEELIDVKEKLYPNGSFQMQFSIHTSEKTLKRELIPCETWDFEEIASYARRFLRPGDKKITLNFATPEAYPIEPSKLIQYFDPESFIIKLTPVNPSIKSIKNGFKSLVSTDPDNKTNRSLVNLFRKYSYDVILNIGEVEENKIGSNCGLYLNGLRV